jgi:hypothetical protein
MNDDPATVRVALEKLRSDAGTWSRTATGAQGLADVAKGLTLTGVELSFAADATGLTTTYQQLQQRLAALCGQAVSTLNGISGTLTKAADGYVAIEQTNKNNLNQAGEPPR